MKGQGSFEGHERDVVYSVVSSSESKKVISAVKRVDSKAFINAVKTQHLKGHFYQKPKE